ncbi:MAG: hypothetical protein K2P85_01930 [Flavobacteriaceae bacterium]|nr:hypothetical protein [Flavobacteriaceae bacterium]
MQLQLILSILTALFGSTSIVSIYLLWKTRKSEIKKAEATTLDAIDSIYTKMTLATDKKLEDMQKTIESQTQKIESQSKKITELQKQVKQYSDKCSKCVVKEK